MRDPETRDIFYIAFVDNHLVGSYTSGLVESAIDSRNKPKIGLDQSFIETEKLVSGKGACRVFINYARVPQFMSIYLGTRNEYIDLFSNSMNFAGLYLNMNKEKDGGERIYVEKRFGRSLCHCFVEFGKT